MFFMLFPIKVRLFYTDNTFETSSSQICPRNYDSDNSYYDKDIDEQLSPKRFRRRSLHLFYWVRMEYMFHDLSCLVVFVSKLNVKPQEDCFEWRENVHHKLIIHCCVTNISKPVGYKQHIVDYNLNIKEYGVTNASWFGLPWLSSIVSACLYDELTGSCHLFI